jgi:AcrR family transcriptional regulator
MIPSSDQSAKLLTAQGVSRFIDSNNMQVMAGKRKESEQEHPTDDNLAFAPSIGSLSNDWHRYQSTRHRPESCGSLHHLPNDITWGLENGRAINDCHPYIMRAILGFFHSHFVFLAVLDSPSTPRKSPRQERSRRTVDRILNASARIFHECGYSGATTNDIADEAGVSVGSLYQYFPNKDALLVALTRRHIESTSAGLAHHLGEMHADAGFEFILRNVVNFLVAQHELDHLHLLVMHQAPRTQEINAELDRAKSHLVNLTDQLLQAHIEDPHRRKLIARMVVATIDASVHDVILRQPKGGKRTAAVDLTIATALSIIEAA